MNVEVIKAISGLWPLTLSIVLFVALLLFRKQIGGQVDKAKTIRLKKGDAEFSLSHQENVDESKVTGGSATGTQSSGSVESASEKPAEDGTIDDLKLDPTTSGEWRSRMIDAFLIKDTEEAARTFDKMQEAEADAVAKEKNEVLYLALQYRFAGNTTALERMQELAQRPEIARFAHHWIGASYEQAGQFDQAAEAFKAAAQGSGDEAARAGNLVSCARCMYQGGHQQAAFTILMEELERVATANVATELYEGLASLYELSGDQDLRAFALEKAIEGRPNDVNLRFNTAYSYGENERFPSLAVLHYKAAVGFNDDLSGAWNNLGVQYEKLDMPINSATSYKRAVELKNTLGSAIALPGVIDHCTDGVCFPC